jgi:hypothetical protein
LGAAKNFQPLINDLDLAIRFDGTIWVSNGYQALPSESVTP